MSVKAELTVKKENTVKHSQLEFSGIKRLSFPPPINSKIMMLNYEWGMLLLLLLLSRFSCVRLCVTP